MAFLPLEGSNEDQGLNPHVQIPGPTFDASWLSTTEEQARFHRNLAAVTAVLAGMKVSGVARAYGMATSNLSRLVRRTHDLGQIACVPYATYHRERAVHPALQDLIRKLYTRPIRPTVTGGLRGRAPQTPGRRTQPAREPADCRTDLSSGLGIRPGAFPRREPSPRRAPAWHILHASGCRQSRLSSPLPRRP